MTPEFTGLLVPFVIGLVLPLGLGGKGFRLVKAIARGLVQSF